jgi:hypothetical protein
MEIFLQNLENNSINNGKIDDCPIIVCYGGDCKARNKFIKGFLLKEFDHKIIDDYQIITKKIDMDYENLSEIMNEKNNFIYRKNFLKINFIICPGSTIEKQYNHEMDHLKKTEGIDEIELEEMNFTYRAEITNFIQNDFENINKIFDKIPEVIIICFDWNKKWTINECIL